MSLRDEADHGTQMSYSLSPSPGSSAHKLYLDAIVPTLTDAYERGAQLKGEEKVGDVMRLLTLRMVPSLMTVLMLASSAHGQAITPTCVGADDTAALDSIISSVGSHTATIKLSSVSGSRCAVNDFTIPANVTLDNTDGVGIKVNTGKTLTVAGPLVSPAKPFFLNATSGFGRVSFKGNASIKSVYAEYWGASPGATANENAAAINAASAALMSKNAGGGRGAGVIALAGAGQYDFNATLVLGSDSILFTSISLEGVGGVVGTTLNWTGSTNGTAIYVTNARAVHFSNIFIRNGGPLGTTVGVLLGGPGPGTGMQTTNVQFVQCYVRGFAVNVQTAIAGGAASDGLTFEDCVIDNASGSGGKGILVNGSNSVNIQLKNTSIGQNLDFGLDIASGGDVHVDGGGWGRAKITIRNQAITPLNISRARFELNPTEIAVQATNPGLTTLVSNNFQANSTVPAAPVIQGKGLFALIGNSFGQGNNTGWLPVEVDASGGSSGSLVMFNNRIFGSSPFYIDPVNGTSSNLTYNLFGNEKWAAGVFVSRFKDEAGQILWPNKISFSRASSGIGGTSITPDTITASQNNYTPAVPGTAGTILFNRPMYLRLATNGVWNITGIKFLTPQVDGDTFTIVNYGTVNFVLRNEDTGSTAANRLHSSTGADITLTPGQAADLAYDGNSVNRWRVFKRN